MLIFVHVLCCPIKTKFNFSVFCVFGSCFRMLAVKHCQNFLFYPGMVGAHTMYIQCIGILKRTKNCLQKCSTTLRRMFKQAICILFSYFFFAAHLTRQFGDASLFIATRSSSFLSMHNMQGKLYPSKQRFSRLYTFQQKRLVKEK